MPAAPSAPRDTQDWLALSDASLPVVEALAWAERPDCGAVVSFLGTVRDHAGDRRGVTHLEYEAYEAQVVRRLAAIAADVRARWPAVGRIVMHHRSGRLALGEAAVVVVVSAPHRGEAFDAARHCIDTLKATAPIWKREFWPGGAGELESAWGTGAQDIAEVGR